MLVVDVTRSIARFKTLAGLGVSAGGVRPGAGLPILITASSDQELGDKPAAVQSVGNIPQEPALIAR